MAARSSPKRRRLLVRIGVAVLLVLVLAVIPGYLASRPAYFSWFDGLDSKYEPWSKSTHVAARCQDCHVRPDVVSQATHSLRMLGEFYYSLVARKHTPDVFATPANAACLSCHVDLRAVSPKGDLRIPHKAHVNILKMRCVQCHKYLNHEKGPSGKYVPAMTDCLKCHDGDRADNACTACHTKKAAPESHNASEWPFVHPKKATKECEKCHAWVEDWCVDCHTRRPKSHGADWRKTHRDRVASHRNCEACHASDLCIRCHGELPQLNYDPNLKLVQ